MPTPDSTQVQYEPGSADVARVTWLRTTLHVDSDAEIVRRALVVLEWLVQRHVVDGATIITSRGDDVRRVEFEGITPDAARTTEGSKG